MPLPALYLAVHLVFEVRDYFPRHLIIAYLAMGLVGIYVVSGRGWRATAPKGASHGLSDRPRQRPTTGVRFPPSEFARIQL